jgi:hypothetical protein
VLIAVRCAPAILEPVLVVQRRVAREEDAVFVLLPQPSLDDVEGSDRVAVVLRMPGVRVDRFAALRHAGQLAGEQHSLPLYANCGQARVRAGYPLAWAFL